MRFRNAFGVQGLERRIGAVSRLAGLLYWSTTAGRWQPLILDAYAASGPTGARRADFSPDELVPGRNLYTQQEDNVFGKTTYCMRIASKSAARLVFTTENTSTIRLLSMPVFSPGEIQSVCFLERESGDIWRYYGLTRMGKAANLLPSARDASLINRAVASFRYLAGIPADKEPPAAR